MPTSTTSLFEPVQLGELTLPNRLIMPPLTRCRAVGHVPNELMAEYYAQRAGAGLVISECTMVTPGTSAFGNDPGIYAQEQIAGWKKTTEAVHQAGGRIFVQIRHGGRACHPLFNEGKACVAPSAIAIEGETQTPEGMKSYTVPHELGKVEIGAIVQDFRKEAANAIADKMADSVAFGTAFLANPNLPARIKAGAELNTPVQDTFYTPGPKGILTIRL